jgi:PKHD-type hydroxylase
MLKDFLSKEECVSILESSKKLELKPAKVRTSSEIVPAIRASNVRFYNYYEEFPFLRSKLIQVFNKHVQVNGHEINPNVGKFQFTEYREGGHYIWHTDSGVTDAGRYCSMVLQLNDEYEGGLLEIEKPDSTVVHFEKGVGSLCLFVSHLMHRVTPVTAGIRYSLVNWFELRPIPSFKKTLI